MFNVNPKKSLGQHYLADKNIARKITGELSCKGYDQVIEIGPGMGILTEFLLQNKNFTTTLVEIDRESVKHLKNRFPGISNNIMEQDFLEYQIDREFSSPLAIIGNLPYNISSQIFFKILENRNLVNEVVCMVQNEVAERIVSPPGSKVYGILSVLIQAWYKTELIFRVDPQVFIPPPRVKSAVIKMTRNKNFTLECNEKLFFKVVKTAFNQRRKMLRNSLGSFLAGRTQVTFSGKPFEQRPEAEETVPDVNLQCNKPNYTISKLLTKRPEQLSVNDFACLTNFIESDG